MKCPCLSFAAGVLLCAELPAQRASHSMLRPVTGRVRDAGVYHIGLGTWTEWPGDFAPAAQQTCWEFSSPLARFT